MRGACPDYAVGGTGNGMTKWALKEQSLHRLGSKVRVFIQVQPGQAGMPGRSWVRDLRQNSVCLSWYG